MIHASTQFFVGSNNGEFGQLPVLTNEQVSADTGSSLLLNAGAIAPAGRDNRGRQHS
jgi:hypothetical protein